MGENQVAPPSQGPPEKPVASPSQRPPGKPVAPPSHRPQEEAPPPLSQGPGLPKGSYELYMGGPSAHSGPIWQNRRVKNAELILSRTYRVNFLDQDPYSYEHCSMHCGPPMPRPQLPPYRHMLPPPSPPCCQMHSPPPPVSPQKYILPGAPPPPTLCLPEPPYGSPSVGYHDDWLSDENPNGCVIM
ncbi:hypothetical protein U1Q18_007926 [Sarracenia purpurea var. burkii]